MLGSRLSKLRKASGKTQEETAAYLGISRPAYTAYESGRRQPDYAILQQIADLHRVTIDFLLGRPDAFGQYVAHKRAGSSKSVIELAEEACLSPRLLAEIESGAVRASDLRPQELDRLAAALRLSTIDLVLCRDPAPYDVPLKGAGQLVVGQEGGLPLVYEPPTLPYSTKPSVHVPILSMIGVSDPVYTEQEITDYELVSAEEAQVGDHFYLRVEDDALIGSRIRGGDLVLISQSEEVDSGAIGLAVVNGAGAVLRRIYFLDGMIILQADNPLHPPVVCPAGDVKIIGPVKHVKFWL